MNILICTTVQIFLVNRCGQIIQISLPPASRGTVGYKIRLNGLMVFLSLSVALCFGSGLGAAISLRVGQQGESRR